MTTPSIVPWPAHTRLSGETVRIDGYAVNAPAALNWLTQALPRRSLAAGHHLQPTRSLASPAR